MPKITVWQKEIIKNSHGILALWRKLRNFAHRTLKWLTMAVAVAQSDMVNVALRIPKMDFKRMKGIAKAMGWDIFQTQTQTAAEVRAAQEAYVKETLTRALAELDDPRLLDENPETLDDFLKEL